MHGEVLRPLQLVSLPGGKGVNAARAAARLGGRVMTTGIAGGHAGRWIEEALAEEGLDPHWSYARAESRTTYVTVDRSGEAVIVYEHPAPATDEEFAAFLELLEHRAAAPLWTGHRGRQHPGRHRCARPCRDRSGLPAGRVGRCSWTPLVGGLLAALDAGPDVVKIGRIEAVEAGLAPGEATAVRRSPSPWWSAGASLAIVTDGARDVAAADAERTWHVDVPRVEAVNAVGSGDSFNAGFSLALLEGASDRGGARLGASRPARPTPWRWAPGMLDPAVARRLESEHQR